jgi:hypothetical protein
MASDVADARTGRTVTVKVEFDKVNNRLEQRGFDLPEDRERMRTLKNKDEGSKQANEKKEKHVNDHNQHHGDHPLILLSVTEGDQIKWVGPKGFEVKMHKDDSLGDGEPNAPDNPFGWQTEWKSDNNSGEVLSGPALRGTMGDLIIKQGQYKFSLRSKDFGDLDPNTYFCL